MRVCLCVLVCVSVSVCFVQLLDHPRPSQSEVEQNSVILTCTISLSVYSA